MTLLDRIKILCDAKGETLASLERQLHFGNGTIRRWGDAIPSGDKLSKVADFFNVSVDYLLGRTDNGSSSEESIKWVMPTNESSIPCFQKKAYTTLACEILQNSIDAIGRDGSVIHRDLSDEQFAAMIAILSQLPDASGDL